MLNINEDILEAPQRRAKTGSARSWRFSLTAEKKGHYLSLEMPVKLLAEKLNVREPDCGLRISYIPVQASESAGLEKGRYVVVRNGGATGLRTKARGAATRSIRLGTWGFDDMTEEKVRLARVAFENDETPIEAKVGDADALVFKMPEWAENSED